MNSSLVIKQEYFELLKKLNQSNKHKNQVTDVYFYIDSTNLIHLKLYAAISEYQKLLLCEKIKVLPWAQANITDFVELEQFLCNLLNTIKINCDLTGLIKSHIFKFE